MTRTAASGSQAAKERDKFAKNLKLHHFESVIVGKFEKAYPRSFENESVLVADILFSCQCSRADLVVSISVLVLLLDVLEPLPLLSEFSPFRTFRLSVDFSLWSTIPFETLCPSGSSALQAALPFGSLCPLGHSAL